MLVAFLIGGAFAGTTGKIAGKVTDKQTGEPLPGVNVVIGGTNIGAATNIQGEFFIINVPPGTYTLKVNLIGYRPVDVKNVVVTLDLTSQVDLALETETIDVGTITVEAERPLIEKDLTSSRMRISPAEITNSAVPGLVNRVNVNAGNVLGSFRGGRVAMGEVVYLMDGVNLTNPLGATYGILPGSGLNSDLATFIPDEAVSEAEVLTGGFGAEYPSVQSAVVNVVTKEGGKVFSGKFKSKSSPDAMLGYGVFGKRKYGANGLAEKGVVPYINPSTGAVDSNAWVKDPLYDKYRRAKVYDMRQHDWSLGGPVPLDKVDIPGEMNFFTSGSYQTYRDTRDINFWRKAQTVQGRLTYNLTSSKKLTLSGLTSYSNFVPFDSARARVLTWGQTTYFSGPVYWQSGTGAGDFYRPQSIPAGSEPFYVKTPEGLDTVYSYTPYGWIVGHGHTYQQADSAFFTYLNQILGLPDSLAYDSYPGGEFPRDTVNGLYLPDAVAQAASMVEALGWAKTYQNYDMSRNQYYAHSWSNEINISFNNNLSPRSYYTISFSRFYTAKRARTYDPFDGHPLTYAEMHEDRFINPRLTSFQTFDADPMFLDRRFTQDDHQTIYTLKGDFNSQVNSYNLMKTGFELKSYDLFKDGTSIASGQNDYNDQFHYKPIQIGAYAQNKLESEGMILTVGLRYDFFDPKAWVPSNVYDALLPEFVNDPNNTAFMFEPQKRLKGAEPAKIKQQLSPRVGFSFPITDMDVLHVSYGHYFQLPMFDIFYMNSGYDLRGAYKYIGNPNVKEEKTVAYEAGLEHGFNDYLKFAVTGFFKDVSDLADFQKITYPTGTIFWVRANADYARIKGFEFTLTQRPWHNLSGVITYTYQIARGRASMNDINFNSNYYNRKPITEDFPLDSDQRHTARVNVNYRIPINWGPTIRDYYFLGDWGIDFFYNFGSGTPYSSSSTLPPPDVLPVNDKTFPNAWSIDLRVDKGFALYRSLKADFFVEVRNLTNRANILLAEDAGRYDLTHDPSGQFALPNAYSAPRRILLGFETTF
jgi:outer membrane receptor protein involved in Fe transport